MISYAGGRRTPARHPQLLDQLRSDGLRAAGDAPPRRYAGRLHELVRPFPISIQLPTLRSDSETRLAELVHRFQEARLPFRRDCEVHRDEDRSDERVPADQKVNSGHLGDA